MEKAKKVLGRLEKEGFSAYIVGGAVRDFLLGVPSHDIDIATSAKPDEVMAIFPKGYKSGIKFGTVTVIVDEEEYEITTYRKEGRYEDGRHPSEINFSESIVEDLMRRDFTINAMAMDARGEILDPFLGGISLKRREIEAVGRAADRFEEDSLRILRCARFASQLGFKVSKSTLRGARINSSEIQRVSEERVFQEMTKILMTDKPSIGIGLLEQMGVLREILPDVSDMVGVEQNNPHHYLDVFNHTMAVLDKVERKPELRWAALLHHVGKPQAKETFLGKDTFHEHVDFPVIITKNILEDLKCPTGFKHTVMELVQYHEILIPAELRPLRRLKSKLKYNSFDELFQLRLADIHGQSDYKKPEKLKILMELREMHLNPQSNPFSASDLAITGHDLMALGYKGPELGRIIKELTLTIVEEPEFNEREKLLDTARKLKV